MEAKERNYSIDLIKVIAIFFVVMIHNLLQGGILENLTIDKPLWFGAFTLENIGIIAVNLFAMVSGFLGYSHPPKIRRLIDVLIQATFWSWTVLLLLKLLGYSVSIKQILSALSGFVSYWYVSAYLGMTIILFAIRPVLLKLSTRKLALIIGLGFVFSSIAFVFPKFLNVELGYSISWLFYMYIIGFFLKKTGSGMKYSSRFQIFLGYLFLTFFNIGLQYGLLKMSLPGWNRLLSYNNPVMILTSVLAFLMLSSFQINSSLIKKVIIFSSKVSFGIYLLDVSLFYSVVLKDSLTFVTKYNIFIGICFIILTSLSIFFVFGIFERIRIFLFDKLCYQKLLLKLENNFLKLWNN